jgi:outer membrane protein assembly factor BamB
MKPTNFIKFLISLLITAVSCLALSSPGQDWPEWGGTPARNMFSPSRDIPHQFTRDKKASISFKQGTEEIDRANLQNLKWVSKIGSQSYGNVTVAKGKVFIGTNNESPRDSRHPGDRSILMCFDEKTGELLWQLAIPKLASGKVNDWEALGLLSSPTIDGDRVYIVSSRCEVLCLDINGMANGNDGPFKDEAKYYVRDVVIDKGKPTEHPAPPVEPGPKDGDILWRYDMIDELGVFPHNASDCAPLIIGNAVYVNTSNGQDWTHSNIPSPNAPSLIALNKQTGELLGEDDAKIGPRILHGQWSSPSTGNVNGKQLVFFGGGDGLCYAFDATPVKEDDASYLKKVWWYDCNPPDRKKFKYPDAEGPSEINATPVFWKNRVYVPVGQDPEHGEGVGAITCIDATKTGDVTGSARIWSYEKINRSISTVSITPEGLLFVADFSGYLYCFDAENGKLYWSHDLKAHIWGSTLVVDGKVYIGDEDGDLAIFEATKEKKLLNEINLGAPVYSTPVVANGVLYVASNSHLFAFANSGASSQKVDQPQSVEIKLDAK